MSSFVILLFIICHPVICKDLCQLIAPNNTYNGVGIYQRFNVSGNEYWMYNRQGLEWKVVINTSDWENPVFVMDYESKREINRNIRQRFGIFVNNYPTNLYYPMICDIIGDSKRFVCHIVSDSINIINRIEFKLNNWNNRVKEFLFVNIYPMSILVPDKEKRKERNIISLNKQTNTLHLRPCDSDNVDCSTFPILRYIEQMDKSLLATIVSALDYTQHSSSPFRKGNLLLFDINDRPYYCVLEPNETITSYEQVIIII